MGGFRDAEIYMEYLGMKDRRTRDVESRLSLNELNEPHFKKLVVDNVENEDLKAATLDKTQGQSNLLLSNLTLIEKSINRAAGSISFLEKKEQAYSLSEITLNKELCNYSVWTVSEIESRQKDLADIALKVWSLPYL